MPRLCVVAVAWLLAGCGVSDHPAPHTSTVESSGLRAVEVARGLDRPVYITAVPDENSRLYVVGQAGVVSVLEGSAVSPEPFLDISSLVRTSPKGAFASEEGLLSMAFATDYTTSGRLFVDYTDGQGQVNIVEYRARSGVVDPSSARTLLVLPKRNPRHHGGQLQIGPEGALYVSLGDDRESQRHAQSLDQGDWYAKILRLRHDTWEVVAYGLRNPWRFSFDRETGDLWIADVGENRFEEVNLIPRSEPGLVNFGWDAYEGHEAFSWKEGGHHEPRGPGRLAWPIAVYAHDTGCSVVGGYVYRGETLPEERGRYLFGDYCTGAVWSLDPSNPAEVRHELDLGTTLVSFGEDADGELYLVSRTGRIFRLMAS